MSNTPRLFVDHNDAATLEQELEAARTQIRRAIRYLTKAESAAGQRAHGDAHDAERSIERALKLLKR
jgi:hypothetical protein